MATPAKSSALKWALGVFLLYVAYAWWKRKPAATATTTSTATTPVASTGTTVYENPESDPNNPPTIVTTPPEPVVDSTPVTGVSYYTIASSPGILDITDDSFNGIAAQNIALLNAYPSSWGRGDRGSQLGVYDAYVQARKDGSDTAPYLAELNAALHAIYPS